MSRLDDIKVEIIQEVSKRHSTHPQFNAIKSKVENELEQMGESIGLENRNNLEVFYQIWKANQGKTGEKNDINSATAYALGMTKQKPQGGFLPQRRCFARAGFPDIDTDFDYENRDDVYGYIINRYGRENVGNIGTHGLLKFKSCVTRVAKALDVADAFDKGKDAFVSENAEAVTQMLFSFPKTGLIKVFDEDGNSHLVKTFADAVEYSPDFRDWMNRYPDVKHHCGILEGMFANFGYHAAGMVVSNVPLNEIAPLRTAKQGVLATQFPNEDLELLGLIKFDILAISTLSVIKKTVEMVKENWGIEVPLENLPMDDDATLALYRAGNLGGVFQCENYGMQKTMMAIGVDRFEDVVAGLALYRPGPMDSIPSYCARKKGEEKVDYFHPKIEPHVKPYLEKTYGVLCYQEQVMQICNALAGFTITDGYVMIKAIGKKKEDLLKRFETQFIEGCGEKGVPQAIAYDYWHKFITPFSSYGFNLAHSACYGYNSYTTAYLKANYPDEFVCAFLDVTINSSQANRYEKVEKFEREFAKKMNIKFLSRDVNKCGVEYRIEKRKDKQLGIRQTSIRPTLLCKGVSLSSAQHIQEKQPFKDLKDFVNRTDSSVVDVRVFEALAENGFFGSKAKNNVAQYKEDFVTYRSDLKKAEARGRESVDMFNFI